MKSVPQLVDPQTRRFIRAKIRQELDPGVIMALAESEMHAALAEALNRSLLREQTADLGQESNESTALSTCSKT